MKLTDLRGILQYIPQFREKTFIINVDGAIVTDENFANILVDIAVLRSLSIRVVLVHGASAQIRALAAEQGINILKDFRRFLLFHPERRLRLGCGLLRTC